MKVMFFLLWLIVLLLLVCLTLLWWRTYKTEHSANQAAFSQGTADLSLVDGNYAGRAAGYEGAWQGKTFYQSAGGGINRFADPGGEALRYPFRTYVGKGLRDKALDVMVLDYNQPGNPWWLRFIVDEMVSVAPNAYLGKVHVRVAPGIVFSVGYFSLEKI